MQKTDAKWIWNANTNFDAHQYAVFRKEFTIKGRSAALHITADSAINSISTANISVSDRYAPIPITIKRTSTNSAGC